MRVKVGDFFLETDNIAFYKWDSTLREVPEHHDDSHLRDCIVK